MQVRESLLQFKRDLAYKTAENSKTGKPIPEKVALLCGARCADSSKMIDDYERQELTVDKLVQEERLKYISLRNQLQKLENQLRKKEELKDGLHLIDFEQLKMENQTYNEKIEERNEVRLVVCGAA